MKKTKTSARGRLEEEKKQTIIQLLIILGENSSHEMGITTRLWNVREKSTYSNLLFRWYR